MSQECCATVPDLDGNTELFNSIFKLVSIQANADNQPCEIVLIQIIYHATRELFFSEMPYGHVQGVVEAAALYVAAAHEDGDAETPVDEVGGME